MHHILVIGRGSFRSDYALLTIPSTKLYPHLGWRPAIHTQNQKDNKPKRKMEKELVRSVVRAFFGTEEIILVDALVNHNALSLDDAVQIFVHTSKSKKEIGTKLKTLKEGGLVSLFQRQEIKPGAQKSTLIDYYFIDYRFAIDATKYKLHMLQSALAAKVKPTAERNEFLCPQCKAEWTLMEALDRLDPLARGSGFLCKTCGNLLDAIAIGKDDEMDHNNPLSRFNKQFDWLIKMLGRIDQITVPETPGDAAVESKKEVPREREPGFIEALDRPELQARIVKPAAVHGLSAVAEKVSVVLTTEQENTAAAQRAALERKEKIAAQNQLPQWHTQSTVQPGAGVANGVGGNKVKRETEDKSSTVNSASEMVTTDDDDVVAAYKKMAEQAHQEELRKQAEEDAEEDSDEEEDDFEEVEVAPPDAKKIKLDDTDSAKASDSVANTPLPPDTGAPVNGEESDEDEEFEDVI